MGDETISIFMMLWALVGALLSIIALIMLAVRYGELRAEEKEEEITRQNQERQ